MQFPLMPNQVLNLLLAQWQCSNLGPSPYPYPTPTSISPQDKSSLTGHRVGGGVGGLRGGGGGSHLNIHQQKIQQNQVTTTSTPPPAPTTAASTVTAKKPLMNRDFPDPSIIRAQNGTYYAFATASNGRNVQAAWSPSPSGPWTYIDQEILPFSGNWTLSATLPGRPTGNTWAPDVRMLRPDHYVMYYSGQMPGNSSAYHCIGAATADSVLGPYTPLETPLACPLDKGGAIDASGFFDEDTGKRYVLYKVDGNSIGHGGECNNGVAPFRNTPIMLVEVDKDDGVTPLRDGIEILDREESEDGPLVEAPSLVRVLVTRDGDGDGVKETKAIYVLFYSSHCFLTDLYRVNYATAENVTGPYVRAGNGGLPLISTGGNDGFNLTAPGGATGLDGGGSLVFHANCPEGRCLFEAGFGVSFDGVVSVT